MRSNPTKAEGYCWQRIRNRQIGGLKFRRQCPIQYFDMHGTELYFIVDFVCKSIGLVIEVDGEIHHYSQVADTARTKIIETDYNYRLLRLSNQEVLEEWSLVEDKILALIR